MAYSTLVITVNSVPTVGTRINIIDTPLLMSISEQFELNRTQIGQVSVSPSDSVANVIYNLRDAINLDSNLINVYRFFINLSDSTLTITSKNTLSQFAEVQNTTEGALTIAITNEIPEPVFTINSVSISEATTSPCENVKATITTNEQADTIASPISQVVTTNPLVIDLPRDEKIIISLVKGGVTKTQTINVPKLLSTYFELNILNTPSSASVTVNNTFLKTPLFTLEYSIDNITWQSSNYFNGLTEGDYTIYIRDSIGCSTTKTFSVDTFTANLVDYDAIAEVSNLNPIRYKEVIQWDETSPKTPNNTLSFEEDVKLPNTSFTQPFITTDTPITQVKTNYSSVSAKIIDTEGNDTSITVFKMTENMNVTDVRDGLVLGTNYNGLNYVSVKFSGGNTYDKTTLLANGDYNLGTSVPTWLNAGDYVNIQGAGWHKVLEIVYNTDAYVIVLNLLVGDFTLTLGTYKITSIYNTVDFERYEFTPVLTGLSGYYQIQIDLTDAEFVSKTYLSEWLNISTAHLGTKLIEYYNTENNEINFNTGFVGCIRIPLADDLKWKTSTEQDIYVTDTNTVNLDSKYRGFWDFSSRPLPTMMAEKLALILLQDRLFINKVNYLAEEAIESNTVGSQYQIKASLVKANYVYNNNSGLGIGEVVLEGTPLMITNAGGFLLVE